MDALNRFSDRLALLSSHEALFLLKNCFSIPRLLYTLRTSPAWKCNDILAEFDKRLKFSLSALTNTKLDQVQWGQASLPVSMGGLGLRRSADIALSAFLSSVFSTNDLVAEILRVSVASDPEAALAVDAWKATTNKSIPENIGVQKEWDRPIADQIYENLLHGSVDSKNRPRLLAVATKESGAWLHALPSSSLGLLMDNDTTRIACSLRLGVPLCKPHTCRCGHSVEGLGLHGLACRKYAGRKSRHDSINDIILRGLSSAGIPSIAEPPGTCRDDGKRPDGLTLVPWSNGRSLLWDVTCVDTLAESNITYSTQSPGGAAAQAELRKTKTYASLKKDHIFVAAGFETLGSCGPSATKFIREIGNRIRQATGETRSSSFLRQKISVAIQRGNAACVTATLPCARRLDEIFYF
ncbi:Uncharacterised protein r2_g3335 [Pycnogonum litorale]